MAETTRIEWTEATWNPVTGCRLVSEGCRNCYAARLAATRMKSHPSRAGLARIAADGPRYKAIGNSMPGNVMRWIGRRIDMVRAVTGAVGIHEKIARLTTGDDHG